MRFRWTMEELKATEGSREKMLDFIRAIVVERQSTTTNVYSPLSKTLKRAENFLLDEIAKDRRP